MLLISGEILGLCDSFCLATREFYFDRSPRIFENILGLYRKGELHLTESVCPKDFVGELEYWGLSSLYLEPCCAYTLQRASWLLPVVEHGNSKDENVNFTGLVQNNCLNHQVDLFDGVCGARLRSVIWTLFEDPNSSSAARVTIV